MYYDKNLESIDDLQVNNLKVIQKKTGFVWDRLVCLPISLVLEKRPYC